MEKQVKDITRWIETNGNRENVKEIKRFGVTAQNAYGLRIPQLMAKAREIGRDHELAMRLWDTGIHDARLLATMIADPKQVTPDLMDRLAADFDSWDICDQCCMKLFRMQPAAHEKVYEWAAREEEFVRRAAFALIAEMTIIRRKEHDEYWIPFFDLIIEHSTDGRNFVKKAVNWALRQIGKQSPDLYEKAKAVAQELAGSQDAAARWIGKDALREFNSPKVNVRVNGKVVKNRGRQSHTSGAE